MSPALEAATPSLSLLLGGSLKAIGFGDGFSGLNTYWAFSPPNKAEGNETMAKFQHINRHRKEKPKTSLFCNLRKLLFGFAAGALISSSSVAKAEFVFGTPKPVPNVNTIEYGECL